MHPPTWRSLQSGRQLTPLTHLILFLALLALSACQEAPTPTESASYLAVNQAETPPAKPPVTTLTEAALPSPTITDTPIPPTATRQPSPTPSLTPSPEPSGERCSPLVEHPLEELPQIISDPYRPPPPGREERHHGLDLSYYRRGERTTIRGVGVQAVLAGQVAAAIPASFPYGNVVIIETPARSLPPELREQLGLTGEQSLYLLYAHMETAPLVAVGEPVEACRLLGQVGSSGNAVEPHLHFEVRTGPPGRQFLVMGYYQAESTAEEKENYLAWRIGGDFRHIDPLGVLQPPLTRP